MFNSKFNPYKLRTDFKILDPSDQKSPIYFDNACMTLKPDIVVSAITDYYHNHPSCHNRASHDFAEITTKKVQESRQTINKYINCRKNESIVFTKNTTESINMLSNLIDFKEKDIVLTTDLEHNSNILPWQFLQIKKNILFKQIPISPTESEFDLEKLEQILKGNQVKLVSVFHLSNITGIILPIKEITNLAHKYGALVLLDAAQSVAHMKIDVQDLNIDFMAFSIHKAFGPTGMGVLYAKEPFLSKAIPYNVGGEGVLDTTYDSCTLDSSPQKFEVGLQNYAGIIGSGAAIKYISKINLPKAHSHVIELNQYISEKLLDIKGITTLGPQDAKQRNGILNFVLDNNNVNETAILLSKMARIMVRSGVHCGHAWYHKYKLSPSLRISLAFYNTKEELDIFYTNLKNIIKS